MPFEFLSDMHLARYGQYAPNLTALVLGDPFHLQDAELARLKHDFRHDHTRLGYTVQRATLLHLGTFLVDPTAVPDVVLNVLAQQLGISNPRQVLPRYLSRRPTRFDHQAKIKDELGYKDFDRTEWLHLTRWLYSTLRLSSERPIVLFDHVTKKLVQRKIVLPGATTLAKLIVAVRERVTQQTFVQLARRLTPAQQRTLDDLLVVAHKERFSPYEKLRAGPTLVSGKGIRTALDRLQAIRKLGLSDIDLTDLPSGRLGVLQRDGLIHWTSTLSRMAMPRRYAILLATLQHLELHATDDVLDIFDAHMNDLGLKGERKRRQERLRYLKDLDGAALLLRDAMRVVLNEEIPEGQLRQRLKVTFGADQLTLAIARVTELASDVSDQDTERWMYALHSVRQFFPALIEAVKFGGTAGTKPLLDALEFLSAAAPVWSRAPRSFVPKAWETVVFPFGQRDPDKRVYQLCVAHGLHEALKRREVFVIRSGKYGDPRSQLLQGEAWDATKSEVLRALDLPDDPKVYVQALASEVDGTYRAMLARLPDNAFVRVEHDVVVLTPLDKMPDTESYRLLERQTDVRLPVIDLSELLLETNSFAPFIDAMVEAVDGAPRRGDIATSICAVLVAEACNIGLKAVARSNIPALTLGRLSFVKQHYVRLDALLKANAVLVGLTSLSAG
ncbi:DUF4158 domain-containing protein [Deinococcus peraridilitoris]|uniref:Transposase n=1 Tax=Deinococcus peraridilitoris (strain DSM 19664 / LMG 22246 / CIP 109416 / KR-200) TaxID=937777 RepID=L0A7M9_DEIPD|nr:DUF4158 domain-containing protein [Deinococcus peraridilitoris]AFZ69454.1 Transposase [Deinococcus peraridilitoris DSM 19664]